MNKYCTPLLLFVLIVFAFNVHAHGENKVVKEDSLHLIPVPQEIILGKGSFHITANTQVYTNLKRAEKARILDFIKQSQLQLDKKGKKSTPGTLQLLLIKDNSKSPEAYSLQISSSGIKIKATAGVGIFYGLQSLLQLINQYGKENIPVLTINDSPYLQYRGLMIDVSRHFFSKEFIEKQLDMMAYYKINRLHWHLVDGAGWRIEIKKYPELTRNAAWRPYENLVEWSDKNKLYCTKDTVGAYGGYYTQKDIKEVVKYASERYITIIPEIEMPGHSEEVLAVFPQLSCKGKPYTGGDFCVGNPETFVFLKNVLTEVMKLFPSEYIHIGGDEAGKKNWVACDKCRNLMKKEGMKNVDELQSYMIHRIEKFLNSKGRRLLGWDEIMQGGLAPNATVMSWRGEEHGVEAVKNKHDAIMTPIKYCYFNFYQDAPYSQPLSWAGYTPIEKVYSYNPVPDSLSLEEKKNILGIQANMWTEYIPTEENAEMMIWPRLLAIAETGWSLPEKKSYKRFRENALEAVDFLKSEGYKPFELKNEVGERKEYSDTIHNLAFGKHVEYKQLYNLEYPAGRETALTDGLQGGWSPDDNRWQGFLGNDMDVVIDLGSDQLVHTVYATFMQDSFGWYWMPKEVEIYASADNKDYKLLTTVKNDIPFTQTGFFLKKMGWEGAAPMRYIRYVAKPDKENKNTGFLFVDEVTVK
ncbi:family 20 glycosylhydrolase [uncultured Bacteroides sp.]|uniref:family 20 glycosylhydrolase n=1 Tax=uncultured Bacteroides sp. TaxID=162156 RepID=UPI002AA8C8EC|nr:family 20 glycosylhydrolase [uncultured Bacteroides sp.]